MKKWLHSLFIPHEGNDYRPDMLQRTAVVGMLALILLSFTASNMMALLWQQSAWLVGAVLPAVVVEKTNDERNDLKLPALRRSATLDAAAQMKAEHMAKEGYFAHYSPDGVSPWHWFQKAEYSFVHAGENLAVHFTDSDEVVEAWMDSPTHRANIVNGNYEEIGVGTAKGRYEGYDTVFVVQLFGTPAVPQATILPIVVVPEPVAIATADEAAPSVAGAEVLMADDVVVVETIGDQPVVTPQAEPIVTEGDDSISFVLPEPVADESVPQTPVTTTVTPHDTVVVESALIATTTNLEPLPAEAKATALPQERSFFGLFTAPHEMLQLLYIAIGTLVAFALFLSVCIEWRHTRPRQVVYGVGLLLLLSLLSYVHVLVTSGVVIS